MNETPSLAKRFEELCQRLFAQLGEVEHAGLRDRSYDFRLRREQEDTLVEAKLYKSKYVPTPWLWSIAERLQSACDRHGARSGILAVTCRVTDYTRGNIRRHGPRVDVFDPGDLGRLAASDPDLSAQLRSLLREALDEVPSEFLPLEQMTRDQAGDTGITAAIEQIPLTRLGEERTGEELCKELQAVQAGRGGYRDFEKVGERALRYLFSEDFSFFEPQHVRDDLQRTDIVGKLAPTVDFWKGIARDFRTRYVVFEFKNYVDEITSDQIYSTEKYLFTTALRSVAILIARNGASEQAIHAAKGALRELGKLIIIVSLDDVCKMLHAKDQDDDPSDILSEVLDKMLMTITR